MDQIASVSIGTFYPAFYQQPLAAKPIRTFKISFNGEKQRVDLFANIQVLLYDQTL